MKQHNWSSCAETAELRRCQGCWQPWVSTVMLTWSHVNISPATGPLWRESIGHRWISLTKASDAELWCFLWFVSEPTVEQTIETPVIWDEIAFIMISLQWFIMWDNREPVSQEEGFSSTWAIPEPPRKKQLERVNYPATCYCKCLLYTLSSTEESAPLILCYHLFYRHHYTHNVTVYVTIVKLPH